MKITKRHKSTGGSADRLQALQQHYQAYLHATTSLKATYKHLQTHRRRPSQVQDAVIQPRGNRAPYHAPSQGIQPEDPTTAPQATTGAPIGPTKSHKSPTRQPRCPSSLLLEEQTHLWPPECTASTTGIASTAHKQSSTQEPPPSSSEGSRHTTKHQGREYNSPTSNTSLEPVPTDQY